jgi:cholinesterase
VGTFFFLSDIKNSLLNCMSRFDAGGSGDPRYNTSYLVNASVGIHKPIIVVSLNYRVGGWGFLGSKEMAAADVLNIGLFDQRLALQWIEENIAAFGGNPEKVIIAGESAGAFSVGYHLTAFDGKNDGLFRSIIMESGNALRPGGACISFVILARFKSTLMLIRPS